MKYGDTRTTGAQPLATLLYGGIYAGSEAAGAGPFLPLRVTIVLNALLLVGTGIAAGEVTRRWADRRGASKGDARTVARFVTMVFVLNPGAFRLYAYGLETGLYLFLAMLVLLYMDMSRMLEEPRPETGFSAAVAGGLIGLTVLARIDFAVISAVALSPSILGTGPVRRRAATMAAVAAVMVLPWIAYVYHVEGTLMPSSGGAQSAAVTSWASVADRIAVAGAALVVASSAVLYWPAPLGVVHVGMLAAVVLLAVLVARPLRELLGEMANWLAGAGVLCAIYVLFFSSGHFYPRYFAPLWLLWTMALAGAAATALVGCGPPVRRRVFLGVAAGLSTLFAVQIGYTVHRAHVSNTHLFSAFYVRQHGASLGRVGAFQSGIIGYLNEGTINLDGKVDGDALRWGRAGHLECYLQAKGVTTIIDWPDMISGGRISPAFVEGSMRLRDVVPGGASVVMAVMFTDRADTRRPLRDCPVSRP